MKYNADKHHRISNRLQVFDYSASRAYFVTIDTWKKECILGKVRGIGVVQSIEGKIVKKKWFGIVNHFKNVRLDRFIIMPNHIHGIVIIQKNPNSQTIETKPQLLKLSRIIAYFKYVTTKEINQFRGTPGNKIWHRNYYERVVRNEKELVNIREYILNNPANWENELEGNR